jgi:glucokinase
MRAEGGRERRPSSPATAAMVLAIDLGATHVRAALVRPDGGVIARVKEPTATAGVRDGAARLAALTQQLAAEDATRAIVGVPGRVDYERARVEQANNLPASWRSSLTGERLSRVLGLPVSLASDADLAAVGEARFGAGAGFADVAYLTISTGVGAGAVSKGRLLRGSRKLVEIGNLVVDHDAYGRGEPSTFDELASGRALERHIAEAGLTARPDKLAALEHAGDPGAAAIRRRVAAVAAIAALNVAHCYAPDVLVLGGAVGVGEPLILQASRRALDTHGPRRDGAPVELRLVALGDDAALVGAAAWQAAWAR